MTHLLQPEHLAHLLLGVAVPAVLVALVATHYATGRPALVWPVRLDREERGRRRSIRAHARDLAAGPAQLTRTLVNLPAFDDTTDDAVPVDMAALMAEQDREEGEEFVSRIEAYIALETAVTFGFVYLGAPR